MCASVQSCECRWCGGHRDVDVGRCTVNMCMCTYVHEMFERVLHHSCTKTACSRREGLGVGLTDRLLKGSQKVSIHHLIPHLEKLTSSAIRHDQRDNGRCDQQCWDQRHCRRAACCHVHRRGHVDDVVKTVVVVAVGKTKHNV